MTEYEEETNEELVSAFIVGTCQLLPKPYPYPSDHMHDQVASARPKPDHHLIWCGSSAEFYIEPLNTCIDDLDVLIARGDTLVISGCDLMLPGDMSGLSDRILCHKIESYDMYPGFVKLRVWGEIKYNWKCKKYDFDHTSLAGSYAVLDMDAVANKSSQCRLLNGRPKYLPKIMSGPAIKHKKELSSGRLYTADYVECMACPQWPREAKGWIKRPRNNGWPTIDTIFDVLRNGCHVVYVQHRSCRDDQAQWRLSFSLAEVILIQSWTQIQQIVYHLLRYFAKKELMQKDCLKEDEVLCTYHLKTLMLWACEQMSPEWWNSSSVITICSELLKKLGEWLKKRHCPNYFIPEANLFYESSSFIIQAKIECRITKLCNSGIMSDWFKDNYIHPIIWRHLKLPSTIKITPYLMDLMLHLVEYWKVNEIKSLDSSLFYTFARCFEFSCSLKQHGFSSVLQSRTPSRYLYKCKAQNVEPQLKDSTAVQNAFCSTYLEKLLYSLHTAYFLDCEEISWDGRLFVEFVNAVTSQPKMIRSLYHNFPRAYNTENNRFQFLRAQNLMQDLTGLNNRPEYQLLCLMSKEFLRKSLDNDVSKYNEIASAALAYLAALHFATSDYHQAIRLCQVVLVDQTSLKDKETLNAGCLLFIDDVARIVGFCVLQKKITNSILHYDSRRLFLDLRLSPEVFAHYLIVLSTKRFYKHFDFNYNLPNAEFPLDEYLKAIVKSKYGSSMKSDILVNPVKQIVYRRSGSLIATEATTVNHLHIKEAIIPVLLEYALENMTSFHGVVGIDFGIKCHTVDCYRALYLYKCNKYDQVMQLCEQILEVPDLQSNVKIFAFANVLLMPPLQIYFDRDVQSLLGFHTLFYYLSPVSYDMETDEPSEESAFEHRFAQLINYHRCGLAFLLQFHYTVKRHYFVGRHFLARYLKVRCCIDCNLPCSKPLTEFTDQKINFPFENIIRRFLLQTLR